MKSVKFDVFKFLLIIFLAATIVWLSIAVGKSPFGFMLGG